MFGCFLALSFKCITKVLIFECWAHDCFTFCYRQTQNAEWKRKSEQQRSVQHHVYCCTACEKNRIYLVELFWIFVSVCCCLAVVVVGVSVYFGSVALSVFSLVSAPRLLSALWNTHTIESKRIGRQHASWKKANDSLNLVPLFSHAQPLSTGTRTGTAAIRTYKLRELNCELKNRTRSNNKKKMKTTVNLSASILIAVHSFCHLGIWIRMKKRKTAQIQRKTMRIWKKTKNHFTI